MGVVLATQPRGDDRSTVTGSVTSAVAAGMAAGLTTALEVFADRTYEADGQLTKRSIEGSVLRDWHATSCPNLTLVSRSNRA